MPVGEDGGIFVSYRRQDSKHLAGRLYDRPADRFGEDRVFMDVDTIGPGVDFAEEIGRAVEACKVLVAVIGPNWLTATDEQDSRRLDDPADLVRLEIEAALTRGTRVIPVLEQGAVMPGRQDLPESLAGLTRCNALVIRHESFRSDVGRLVTAIEQMLAAPRTVMISIPDAQDVRSPGNAFGQVTQKDSGPARNDRARVTRLLTEAEHVARTTTSEYDKAAGLTGVAAVLTASDPEPAAGIPPWSPCPAGARAGCRSRAWSA